MDLIKEFLNEEQDPKVVEKIYGKISGLLTNGEIVEYIAVQKRPAINLSPDCVALTSKRIIFCRPKHLGMSMDFEDYIWKDVSDCHMKEAIFGAEFSVKSVKGRISSIDFLPKAQARKLYQIAQANEEEQREVRRERLLEEKRAAAGAVNVNSNVPPPSVETVPKQDDPLEAMQKLTKLLENHFITQDEFNIKRTEILSRL